MDCFKLLGSFATHLIELMLTHLMLLGRWLWLGMGLVNASTAPWNWASRYASDSCIDFLIATCKVWTDEQFCQVVAEYQLQAKLMVASKNSDPPCLGMPKVQHNELSMFVD